VTAVTKRTQALKGRLGVDAAPVAPLADAE
jgi:hypothetical protein